MTKIPDQNEIIERGNAKYPGTAIKPPVSSPMEIMASAVSRGMGKDQLEVLERMFEFDLKVKAQQAKEAFLTAFSEFKLHAPDVIKDKVNKQTGGSKYSSTGNFLRTVNPELGRHGLSASFKIDDTTNPEIITVTCVLSHNLGHSDESSMSAKPDTLGPKGTPNKTDIHGRMSTLTQLMRATFSAVTGIYALDQRYDDDGNMAGGTAEETITDEQFANLSALIQETGADEKRFCKYMKVSDLDHLPAAAYERAVKALEAKKK